jgi:hypothetical protein
MKSNYSVIAIATGIILFALGYGIRSIVGEEFYAKELPWLIIFFEITSIIIHKQMVGSDKDNPKRFPAKFMGIQGLKMFLYMIVLFGYSLTLMKEALPFVASFGILYLVFSALEVIFILRDIKAKGGTDE